VRSSEGVFVTDGVNRHKMMLPVEELVGSMERPLLRSIQNGLPYGMPLNVEHDKCRPAGWCIPRGIYLARDMARQLGTFLEPDTQDDRTQLGRLQSQFEEDWHRSEAAPHIDGLNALLASLSGESPSFWHVEGSGFVAPGLAASICPRLFTTESDLVDKDGLVEYRALLDQATQIHPGVFHLREPDILLYAHSFFRRSLSRRNSLNGYLLRSFHEATKEAGVTNARLKLDPDLVGLPASAGPAVMELEYWHGPKYDDAIETIPSGVSEHSNNEGHRTLAGISRTHIWWKDPKTRRDDDGLERQVRTFEVEELIEDPSPGLGDQTFGCRYAHAEYDLSPRAVSHFDGAIRAYDGNAYLERLDRLINRAGKHAHYTKLFRLDGSVTVHRWKRVLSDFFRGNQLIPEYLGAAAEDRPAPPAEPEYTGPPPALPSLSAYLALDVARMASPDVVSLAGDQRVMLAEKTLAIAEVGRGQTCEVMKRWSLEAATMSGDDTTANLARIVLPHPAGPAIWTNVAEPLSVAIAADAAAGITSSVSLAIEWQIEGAAITLSIAGDAVRVARLLAASIAIVRTGEWPSEWIAQFRDAMLEHAPPLDAPVDWPASAVNAGRMALERARRVRMAIDRGANLSD